MIRLSIRPSSVILLLLSLSSATAWSQVTTGSLSGTVTAAADGSALPGVTVTALHQPTGTRYTMITTTDGRFARAGVRVGGPYNVAATLQGFHTETKQGVTVALGQTLDLAFELTLETVEETLVVTGSESNALINSSRTGAVSNVNLEAIENLPTIDRGLEDFARTNPFFSVSPDNDEDPRLTVAGRNNRYNAISIDGAVNNDIFGLADSGTPGGQTQTAPISLDAIQELQLLVAPYDVRQGGFSGGGINAVTRSGSNVFSGSAFFFTRDDSLVGDGPDDFPELGTFDDEQLGLRLGGPAKRDKIFFFFAGELAEKTEPTGFSIGGSTGQDFGHRAEAERFRNTLLNTYGYDPGGFDENTRPRDSDKYFGRLDFNLSPSHNLTFRHNYVDASIVIHRPDSRTYEFPGHAYSIADETNSSVLQLNSVLSPSLFTEGRITLQTIEDRRTGEVPFPYVQVELEDGDRFEAGTERFSTANSLDQDVFELTFDATVLRGKHTLTFGTHNELFGFDNLFIRENFGAYQFESLEAFEAGIASEFDHSFSLTSDPLQSARFDVTQLGFYAGDRWEAAGNVTLTFGLRVDIPFFPDEPTRNPQSEALFGLRTDEMPDGNALWSPRIGFNWDLKGDGKQQLRGGVGIFAGRTPYAWVSNQFSNTGIEFGRINFEGDIAFNPDPFNQPKGTPNDLFTNEIDLIDPNFDFPQVLRTNLGYDIDIGVWGLIGTAEVIFSETREDIAYRNLNRAPSGDFSFDGRPILETLDRNFTDVVFLTNTDRGEQTSLAIKLERPFKNGIYGYLSYVASDSKVILDGTSSQALSNWSRLEVPGSPNDPPLSTSDFEIEDRFNATFSYRFNRDSSWPTTVSLFYNAQSGRPYSTTYDFNFSDFASINGDGQSNDLIFVPATRDDVIITNGTWEDLDAYIRADEGLSQFRGSIVPRNASQAPWVQQLDIRVAQDFEVAGKVLQLTFDVLNFGNLINSDSGLVRFVEFSEVSPVLFQGVDEATGKPIYELRSEVFDPDLRFEVDDLRSRWQAKIGLRFTF